MILSKQVKSALVSVAFVFIAACGNSNNSNLNAQSANEVSVGEELLTELASDEELTSLGLKKKPIGQVAKEKIAEQKKKSASAAKREANVKKALADLRAARALPNKGLMQAKAKCDALSAAVSFLKSTNNPGVRPFDGTRTRFRQALADERAALLKVNGITSCGKVRNLAASLPPAAPVTPAACDEAVPAVDPAEVAPIPANEI
ncbi:MAG: hypothetical protein RL189_1564 [Pseudomonadota bacterium]|jgi:hypothetical protein